MDDVIHYYELLSCRLLLVSYHSEFHVDRLVVVDELNDDFTSHRISYIM